jgi:TRAP-type C4-dicarboxylate transport system substrate-binding protein
MARVNLASFSNVLPEAIVPALPYIFRSTEHRRHVLDGPIGQELLRSLERLDLVGLCFYDTGSRSYYGSKPIRQASDLGGLKVRVPQSGPWVSLLRVPGMNAVPMPYAQVETALKTRAVDLAENNWEAFVTSQHHLVSKYFSETRHSASPGVLIMSKRTWEALALGDKQIIREAAQKSVDRFRALWAERVGTARQKAEAAGVEIISDVDRDSFMKAAENVYRAEGTTPELRTLIDRIKAVQ